MKLTDGKKTVEIRMHVWNGSGLDPDWSYDFFETGSLTTDDATGASVVDDVDYCIDQAQDWANKTGDYAEVAPWEENQERFVFVTEQKEEDTMTKFEKSPGTTDPVEVTLDLEWEGGCIYVMTGTYRAVRVTCGYAIGAETGLHNSLNTYAIAELGAVDDEHNFVPDVWQEHDIGRGILSKQLIGTPKACEGWDPDPDDEDIDWDAYDEWTREVVERLLAS